MKKLLLKLSACVILSGSFFSSGAVAQQLSGGWSPPDSLTREAISVFLNASGDFGGIDYIPFSYSTRLEEGKKYLFYCHAVKESDRSTRGTSYISVKFAPNGKAVVESIQDVWKTTSTAPKKSPTAHPGVGPVKTMPYRSFRKL